MAKTTKTMKITLTEDFLVPTDDGNIIFEPGDEIEIEYEDDELATADVADVVEPAVPEELPPTQPDDIVEAPQEDPLSFAANPEVSADPVAVADPVVEPEPLVADVPTEDEEEVYIEDPTIASDLI